MCGGYQLLGKYYKTNKKTIEGLSILDITTEWQPERLIRNIVLNSPLFEQPVVGFEIMEEGHISVITLRSGKCFTAWEIQENQVMKALYIKM